jgi:hypothetical protein
MRRLGVAVAVVVAVAVSIAAAAPHVHAVRHAGEECVLCLARTGEVARSETPEVAPVLQPAGEPCRSPGLPPVSGAPLGAIPGQSPPIG